MFNKGSTAVLSTPDIPFIVAVKKSGIYSFEEGEWVLQYGLSQDIYKLVRLGRFIFGIGDYGTILRYEPYQKKWTHTTFSVSQRLWDIAGNDKGLIVTHGGSKLYMSRNYGSSWAVVKPFASFSAPPLILATEKVFDVRFFKTPLLISANGFAFHGATLSLLGLRPAGSQHCRYSPVGVFAYCSNQQL